MKAKSLLRRYSLRFLFAAVSLIAISLACAANMLSSISRDHGHLKSVVQVAPPAVVSLRKHGHSSIAGIGKSGGLAMVTYEPTPRWLGWFAMLIGDEPLPRITELQIIDAGFNDSQLSALSEINTLRSIEIQVSQVTDAGLVDFIQKSQVQNVRIGHGNQHLTQTAHDLAAKTTSRHGYMPKWPPPD